MKKILFDFFHIHQYGEVDLHGYQSCLICGKSVLVGRAECKHTYSIESRFTFPKRWYRDERIVYVQECRVCGHLNKFEI